MWRTKPINSQIVVWAVLIVATVVTESCSGGTTPTSPGPTLRLPTPTFITELPFPLGDPGLGTEIFANTCAVCHGPAGNGAPGLAPGLGSPWHAWEHADRQIREWIGNGKFGRFTNMPAYGDILDEQAISDVIAYVKTLWTPEQRASQLDFSLRYEEGYRKYSQ